MGAWSKEGGTGKDSAPPDKSRGVRRQIGVSAFLWQDPSRLAAGAIMEDPPDVLLQTEAALFSFLMTELDLSITFATIALESNDAAKRNRNLDNAAMG